MFCPLYSGAKLGGETKRLFKLGKSTQDARTSTKSEDPNKYSPTSIPFLKVSLPFSPPKRPPFVFRAIPTKLLLTLGILRSFDKAKTAPMRGPRKFEI